MHIIVEVAPAIGIGGVRFYPETGTMFRYMLID
jgi:hypothetical protein